MGVWLLGPPGCVIQLGTAADAQRQDGSLGRSTPPTAALALLAFRQGAGPLSRVEILVEIEQFPQSTPHYCSS